MNETLLFTPGSLTTTKTVRECMQKDVCTWDRDYTKGIVDQIREKILSLANLDPKEYTVVLMQGSGTFSIEAAIGSSITHRDKLLIISNGAYSKRIECIAGYKGINHTLISLHETQPVTADIILEKLDQHPDVTHFALVHCETTTGILNPLEEIAPIVKSRGITLIVDAMGSFGGIPYDIEKCGIDFLVSNSSKCIQGVPGFGFVIAKKDKLEACKGVSHSFSLDLYDQWKEMEDFEGKWRFTSPTHSVLAFLQALIELEEEGGIEARYKRYKENHRVLVEGMLKLGFKTLLTRDVMAPIITAFICTCEKFDFDIFYERLKKRGFIICGGKVPNICSFRIGNIGNLYPDDFRRLLTAIEEVLIERQRETGLIK